MSLIRQVLTLFAAMAMAVAWLIPNKYPPWVSFYNETCMAVALLLFVLALPPDSQRRGMPGTSWFFIGVATIPWLQWAGGLLHYSGDAWASSLYLLGIAVAVATGYQWAQSDAKRFATLLSVVTLVAALVSGWLALNQSLGVPHSAMWMADQPPDLRAIGNLGQPNNLATLIAFGALGLWLLYEQEHLRGISTLSILTLLLCGGAATQSRTSVMYAPLVACGLFYFSRYKSLRFKTRISLVAAIGVVYLLLMWSFPYLEQTAWQSPVGILTDRGISSQRFAVWPILIDGLNHRPWFGYGWLQVASAQYEVANLHAPVHELFAQAHNLFLDLLIFCGYPLGLLLCGAVIYWYVTRIRKIGSLEAAGGMFLLGMFGIHAMLELPHYYSYFLIPAAMWIGLIECSIASPSMFSIRWKWGVCALTTSLLIAVCWRYPEVEEDFRLARFEYLRIGTLHASQPAPDAAFLSTLTAYSRIHRTPPVSGMNDQEILDLLAIAKRYPYAKLLYRGALILALNGQSARAKEMFVKIRYLSGERAYAVFKGDLQQTVVQGRMDLNTLLQSLPD